MAPVISHDVLCLYHKYGHCKYSETCRKFHPKETCYEHDCEIKECLKRHPKSCKYFDEYQRCKFGEFCSFSHIEKVFKPDIVTIRLDALEEKMKEKDSEIEALNEKLVQLEENNKVLKIELTKAIENVTKSAMKEGTDTLVDIFNQKQDDLEKRSNASLDALHQQLSILSNHLLASDLVHQNQQPTISQEPQMPPAVVLSSQSQSNIPYGQKHQCVNCGKTFGSDRALQNHTRKDHVPS